MVGDMHWVIRSCIVVGLVTIGVGEVVAAATRRRLDHGQCSDHRSAGTN
jgi:hypothetical protein